MKNPYSTLSLVVPILLLSLAGCASTQPKGVDPAQAARPAAAASKEVLKTLEIRAAQGAIIEFTTAEDGLYPIVTHAFNFVGRGALGLVKAGDGDPKGGEVAAK